MIPVPRSIAVQKVYLCWSDGKTGGVDREKAGPLGKTAGQKGWSTGLSLKGVCGCEVEPHHTPLRGAADRRPSDG